MTISALLFAVLVYPADGSQEAVWAYRWKCEVHPRNAHIALVLLSLTKILIGVPYTILLLAWQKLICTLSGRFSNAQGTLSSTSNSKYRYWTCLLLHVRIVSYITTSIATSDSDKPQTVLLATLILIKGLLFLKGIVGKQVYKSLTVDVLEIGIYLNLLACAAFSLHDFKTDITKQTAAVAYSSTIITLVGVVIYL